LGAFLLGTALVPAAAESASYRFEPITIDDGLSNSSVSGMVQDENGFLWFGTQAGLNRYDGYEFAVMENDPFNRNSLGHNQIQTMYLDTDGALWIGTYGGLDHYDPDTETFTHYVHDPDDPASLSDNVVVDILRDSRGDLWVATLNGLNRLIPETDRFERYLPDPEDPKSLPHHVVRTLAEDAEGNIWVGTYGGLSRYEGRGAGDSAVTGDASDGFTTFSHTESDPGSLPSDFVMTAAVDPDDPNVLWVGSWDGGLSRFDVRTGRCENFELEDNRIYKSYIDSKGRFWIGTWGAGLILFSRNDYSSRVFTADSQYGITNNIVYSFLEDSSGILWIGTNGGGINKLVDWKNRFIFHEFDPENPYSLSDGKVSGIYEDKTGTLWYGTYNNGINRFDPDTGRFYRYKHHPDDPSTISNDIVNSILHDSRGNLLFATNDGLNRYVPETDSFELIYPPGDGEGIPDTIVYDLLEDRDGNLWIGTYTNGLGLYHTDEDRWEYFSMDESDPGALSNNLIRCLFEDSEGRIWVGTNLGLNKFDPETRGFEKYLYDPDDRSSISNGNVKTIFEDSSGNIWVGTNGGGVNLYHSEDDSFSFLSSKDGLLSNMVVGIEEDTAGDLWFATKQGASVYDRGEESFRVVDDSSGLLSNELTKIYRRPSDGSMHIGSAQGVTVIPQGTYEASSHTPDILLSDFTVNGGPYRPDGTVPWALQSIVLDRKDTHFSFQFAALDYSSPERNTYAYKLEGFDKEWVYTGTRNYGSYTNIPPGRYTLRIIGSGSRKNWNREGLSLAVRVLPPWWRTPLAFIGYGMLALAFTGFGVCRVKRNQRKTLEELAKQESLNAELEHKVKKRTSEIEGAKRTAEEATQAKSIFLAKMSHEIRTPLNGMTGMLSLLRRSGLSEEQLDYLRYCEISVENLSHLVGDLLDLEKIQSGKLVFAGKPFKLRSLVNDSVQFFKQQADEKNLSLDIEVDPKAPDALVGDNARIAQILNNLISNAVKYTESGGVRLSVKFLGYPGGDTAAGEGTFELTVADTGIGIEQEGLSSIFDQFSRLPTGTGKATSGVGLGLAIVKQLVLGMNGTIDVTSSPGGGSVFTVTLPLRIQAPQPEGPKETGSVGSVSVDGDISLSGRVLVAEDERINGMYIKRFLSGMGLEVEMAGDGAEAVRLYEEGDFDLILMDIGLPEMTGYEAARAVRRIEESRSGGASNLRIPIIALTAHAYPEDIEKCYAAGMDSFVSKPIVERILLEEMAKYLRVPPIVGMELV
ncbi:MAG: two-component regulator propeller domain-containing protein, partial [Spirochaetia bacterium]